MKKNKKLLEEFEKELILSTKQDIYKNIKIFEELLEFAKSIGKFNYKNFLSDIEIDLKYAKVINGIKRTT